MKHNVFKLLKVTGKYLILFLLADIIFSNYIYTEKFSHRCKIDIDSHWGLKPNCSVTEKYVKHMVPYSVKTDKIGLRFSGNPRDPNKKNVIFLGDSFTYGLGLNYEDTYVGILEKKNTKYNFLNYGVEGYSPSVYHYQIENIIKSKINFDKVILTLDISDFAEESHGWRYEKNDKSPIRIRSLEKKRKKEKESFKKKNFKASRFVAREINTFFRIISISFAEKNRKKNQVAGRSSMGSFIYTDLQDIDSNIWNPLGFDAGVKKIQEKTIKISSLTRSNNAEFYIIIWPWPDTLQFGQTKFNLEKFAEELCVKSKCKKLINVVDEFNKIKSNDVDWLNNLYIHGDMHTNRFGNEIISNVIMKDAFNEL
jgi:hypothetical protein|tara:strand:+ start:997 stop:2097 length:1101 start_codon:yes stop_codon:yes gene_type:complete